MSAADPAPVLSAVTGPGGAGWLLVALLAGGAGGLVGAVVVALAGRRRAPAPVAAPVAAQDGPAGGDGGVEEVDDLPGFLEHPPGSRPAGTVRPSTPAPTRVPPPAAPPPAEERSSALTRRDAGVAAVTAVAVLALVGVGVGVGMAAGGDGDGGATAADTARVGAPAPASASPTAAQPVASGPAALAFASVPLGRDGVAASVSFVGVVLEQRAVGLTVTYPSLSLTTDGSRALAHLRLPTWNCLTPEPPADPQAAGCARSLVEYADLTMPQLQVSRDGDRLDLAGLFPTYTRPNGSGPSWTGRAYELTASVGSDGPVRGGRAPAAGVLRLGPASAPTSTAGGVNLLQFPG